MALNANFESEKILRLSIESSEKCEREKKSTPFIASNSLVKLLVIWPVRILSSVLTPEG